MQSILIKSAKVIDAESKYNGKNQDILIVDGLIKEISNSIESNDSKVIDIKGYTFQKVGLTVASVLANLDMKKEKQLKTEQIQLL